MSPKKPACDFPINIDLTSNLPYRTGSYLSYDYDGNDNFREGLTKLGLRASGSHQLDFDHLVDVLNSKIPRGGQLYLVDLRQESHVFFDGRAVSWYADKDWSNAGYWLEWIEKDEADQIKRFNPSDKVPIFCFKKLEGTEDHVIPTGYSLINVKSAKLERDIVKDGNLKRTVKYVRIPVTDHCGPDLDAVASFIELCKDLSKQPYAQTWVHFHCHGGDGRTTTFLAMYDMVCWARTHSGARLPSVKDFADRQLKIFKYELDPDNEQTNWKCDLARDRWKVLEMWRNYIAKAGLASKKPFKSIAASA